MGGQKKNEGLVGLYFDRIFFHKFSVRDSGASQVTLGLESSDELPLFPCLVCGLTRNLAKTQIDKTFGYARQGSSERAARFRV